MATAEPQLFDPSPPGSKDEAYRELGALGARIAGTEQRREALFGRRRLLFEWLIGHGEKKARIARAAGLKSGMGVDQALGRYRQTKASRKGADTNGDGDG